MAASPPLSEREHLFAALLTYPGEDDRFGRLLRLRHQLHVPHAVLVVTGSAEDLPAVTRAMRVRLLQRATVLSLDDVTLSHTAVVVPVDEPTVHDAAVAVALRETEGHGCIAVSSEAVTGPRALRAAYLRTRINAALAFHAGLPGPLIDPADVVLPRVLAQLDSSDQRLLLRPLDRILALQPQNRDAYIRTLEVLHRSPTLGLVARELHLHPNSLRYRLDRIEEMTNLLLDLPEQRFALDLAVMVYRFHGSGSWTACAHEAVP